MRGPIVLDVRTLAPAYFPDKDTFAHFENPDEPGCFACNSRSMLVRPIAVTNDFTLLVATARVDDHFVVMPKTWLVYPRAHLTSYNEMPDNWTASVKQAIRTLGIDQPFCTGENWGKKAGQTVFHGHTWIIGRDGDESGLFTENTGLASLIFRAMTQGIYAH